MKLVFYPYFSLKGENMKTGKKNKLNYNEIQELLKSEGITYMRKLKISEKTFGKKTKFVIRPTFKQKTYTLTFNTKKEAEEFLLALPPATTNTSKKKFVDLFYGAIESVKVNNTKTAYYRRLKNFNPILNKPTSEITIEELTNIYEKCTESARDHLTAVLKIIDGLAKDETFTLKLIKLNAKKHYKYISKKKYVHNPEEIFTKMTEISYPDNEILEFSRITFLVMCSLGLRIGEVTGLDRHDLNGNILTVSKTVTTDFSFKNTSASTKTTIQDHTKGKEPRYIEVPDFAMDWLNTFFNMRDERRTNSSLPMHRKLISEPLKVIGKDIGETDITTHTGRHIYGSVMGKNAKNMNDAFKLMKSLGHSSITTTERYITSSKQTAKDIENNFKKLISENLKSKDSKNKKK